MKPIQKKFPIGISNFEEIIKDNLFYVDKTLLIQEVIENSAKVLLFPRPRRFGKTLNMHMLKAFFEKKETSNASLFDGLAISQHSDCMAEQEIYPVIYLTLKDINFSAWEDAYDGLVRLIALEYARHEESLSQLRPLQKREFERIAYREASKADYQGALQLLTEWLHQVYGQPAVVLIDEYDVPIHTAFVQGYYDEAISFIKGFLGGVLKDNAHLHKAVLTGILRVAKESIFSGLNNVEVHSILSEEYADKFGFTEPEVSHMLEQYDLQSQRLEVEQWYNGYGFGNQKIYNPWSIIHFLNQKKVAPYWINTSTNQLIRDLVEAGDTQLQIDHATLLNGNTISTSLNDHIAYSDIQKNRESVWNFLTFVGYLSVEKVHQVGFKRSYEVKIPNLELMSFFEETLYNWFNQFSVGINLERMLQALTKGEVQTFGEELQIIVERVMSFHDVGTDKNPNNEPEKTYHIFVLGLLVRLEGLYEIDSNRESGSGRYDIMLLPRKQSSKGIILEFKRITKDSQAEDSLKEAINQIKDNDYGQRLRSAGFTENLGIALVFWGKQVWWRHCSI